MFEPKEDIYTILSEISGATAFQRVPKDFSSLPALTFFVISNKTELDMNNDIAYQDMAIQIDIWAKLSSEVTELLIEVEEKMRENYYTLDFSQDMEDPSGLRRMITRFVRIK